MSAPTTHRSAEEIGRTEQGPRPLPELGDQRAAADLSSVDTVLANGLRVIAVRRSSVPLVEVRLRIPFGDPASSSVGSTHAARAEVLANTVLTGTATRSRVAVDTELALVGGELDAVVDPERLAFSGNALVSGLDTVLDVLRDALTGATYPVEEVERERARLVERIRLARSQPNVIAREALQRHLYGDHPFAKEMPEAEEVAEVGRDDVLALHAAAVLPRGSVLVVVGDIEPDAAVRAVEGALGGWTGEGTAVSLSPLPEVRGGDVLLVHRAGAVQSQIRLAGRGLVRTDPRYPALQVANLVFGGFFSSRLVENIREDKGYTYSARSHPEFTPEGAAILVDADTASEVTAAALLETRYELGRLGLVPPSESEVDTARRYAIGSLLTATSSQGGLASFLVNLAALGLDIEWFAGHPARLAAVTVEQVAAAALEFFAPSAFTGVLVGDAELLAPQLRSLGGVSLP
ncbi:pitrilysin family protein [Actinosynnema sp. NPDC047251]|uniref:Peptidase M16 domain protein n=1 Tax=Saccharothrix espanaensis (strain ATCC 51144 / DSM 44229 / JCM 9112 / NBRC 15066 / NRRL 15764) TaxID=1179773 RepID=K0JS10_SACES|nr:pitrilysin family protein [Saccharothrix espanaensis]CCH28277.1 Peptidase M16 domain protein [Saccharothrix espanaensis DSM 44229]